MEFKGTKGLWRVSRNSECVVSEDLTQIEERDVNRGHADESYYGGILICESIRKAEDALIIAKAPEMQALLLELLRSEKLNKEQEFKVHKLLTETIIK